MKTEMNNLTKFCKKKVFRTRGYAKAYAKKVNLKYKKKIKGVYWCETCQAYHMTSMDVVSRIKKGVRNK